MSPEQLVERYPLLYHMAWEDSWPSIERHGLLSTKTLLDLFEVDKARSTRLLTQRRPESEAIDHPKFGSAVIRDQKPLIDSKLKSSLTGGLKLEDWYRTLNDRVFFWLTEERLLTLMSAEAYRDAAHDVLILRTRDLVAAHEVDIELTAMNTGATRPMAFPRGRETFKKISAYPFDDRVARRLEPVIELTVLGRVPKIAEYVERVERWKKCKPSKRLPIRKR